jgi:hypothetical protein
MLMGPKFNSEISKFMGSGDKVDPNGGGKIHFLRNRQANDVLRRASIYESSNSLQATGELAHHSGELKRFRIDVCHHIPSADPPWLELSEGDGIVGQIPNHGRHL